MNQSTVIFGFLFAAFLVFITQRGELPIYLGFILATPKQPVAPAPNTSASIDATTALKFAALF